MSRVIRGVLVVYLLTLSTVVMAQPGERGAGQSSDSGSETKAIEPEDLPFSLGVATIPDREMFEKLAYQGPMRMDEYLADLEFVKFIVVNATTDKSKIYWMNTKNVKAHPRFMGSIGLAGGPGGRGRGRGQRRQRGGGGPDRGGAASSNKPMRGALTYLPRLKSPNGTAGLYTFDFQPRDSFSVEALKSAQEMILKTMPFVEGKLSYHAFRPSDYTTQTEAFAKAGITVHLDKDLYGDIAFLPLNVAESFGRLRVMGDESRPSPRDIVICKTLPNQMPRVAGVISEARQTPLSHVNLRAIQDKVPNAFIIDAMQSEEITSLLGKFVSYKVTSQGFKLREATKSEVDEHFESLRPSEPMTPKRDLSKTAILPLVEMSFVDSTSFGAKASNLAALHSLELPEGTVPNGQAVPFYFYDEFMKHNDFYELISGVLTKKEFQESQEVQHQELERIRKLIQEGSMPEWMMEALENAHRSFPEGTSLRCRSSTNNEDLPGFSGAGLYDSFTHRTDEGHLAKSVKQVYASLWNYRAVEEREFYRIDQLQTAMGVLIHPNFSNERANGVAVTDDILYQTQGNYYLNTQAGEDLVTNPDAQSATEEVLLSWRAEDGHDLVRKASDGEPLLGEEHLGALRERLGNIHNGFRKLYGMSNDDEFAMEIEFKITEAGKLVIKQARPWVY